MRGEPPASLQRSGVVIVRGDARELASVTSLVAGSEAVIVALGPSRRSIILAAESMRHVVSACHIHGVGTIVALSGALVPLPDERRSLRQRLRWGLAQLIARPVTEDKLAERDALLASGLCVGKTNGVGPSRAKFEEGAGRGLVAVRGVTKGRRRASW